MPSLFERTYTSFVAGWIPVAMKPGSSLPEEAAIVETLCASALWISSNATISVQSVNVADGYTAWKRLPGGAMTFRLRYRPWWFGSFGVVKPLKTTFAMLDVAPNGMLTGPGTASDEPEKSASISSPSIVTRTSMRIMSSLMPSSSSQSYAAPAAVRQGGDGGAGEPLAVVEHLLDHELDDVPAELLVDLGQPLLADPDRRQLRVEVADHELRQPRVEAEDLEDLVVDPSALHDLRPGQDQALLMHVGRVEDVRRILGAEVHPVRADAEVRARPLVAVEDRREEQSRRSVCAELQYG